MKSGNMAEILIANGAGLLLLIILLICRSMTGRNRRPSDKIFFAIIMIGVMGTILEPLLFFLDGRGGGLNRCFLFFGNSLEYACTATSAVLWVFYVDLSLNRDIGRLKTKYKPLVAVWALMILLLIPNLFGQFLFSLDKDNFYSREPLGYLFFAFLVCSYVLSLVLYYDYISRHGRAQFFPIWMFLAPLFLSLLIQIPFYGISVNFLGCAIGLISIYLNIQSKMSHVDNLTGLYNRAYFEHALYAARRKKRYAYSGIMLDLNDFKKINDTMGHSTGDLALREAAKMLLASVDRDSMAFRFAGDEFIVMVRTAADNAAELEQRTLAVEKRIAAETEKFNGSGREAYRIIFSMGHAAFDTEKTDDEFLRAMDAEMYKDKQHYKSLQKQAGR